MPSLLSFSRLRPQRSHDRKTDAAVLPKEEVGSAIHPKSTASPKVTEADVDNAKRIEQQLPDRAMLAQLREALKTISDVLSEVDDTVLDILDGSDEGLEVSEGSGSSTLPVNTLVLSIDLHLADLQRSSSALCKLVSKCHAEKRIEEKQPSLTTNREVDDLKRVESPVGTYACLQFEPSSHQASTESLPDPVTPDQDSHYYLPTPEFSNFSFSPYQFNADDTACSHGFLEDLAYSPPPLQVRRQRPSSPPATPFMSIAPLKLPVRSFSSESVSNLRHHMRHKHRRAVSSPFDYELGYLDGQISETSGLDRRHSSNLGELSPMIQRVPILRSLKPIDSYRSSLESLPGPRTPGGVNLSGSPKGSRLSSESRSGLEPIGEVDFGHSDAATHSFEPVQYSSTQFSTEEKTWRLRARRRGSELSGGLHADSDEPLSMEELMDFLRQGNSIRQL